MMTAKTRRKPEKPALYSRHPLAAVDGRTKEARLMRRVREGLVEHLGGNDNLTFPQRVLVERAVMLALRCAQIDALILSGAPLTEHDSNFALAWNANLRRTMVELGLEHAASDKPPDWREIVAELRA